MTASASTTWQRPRITFSACLEIGGRWWLVMACGLVLLTTLLLSLQRTQVHVLREARMEIALQGLRERMETNLSLGFELADSEHAQALLEDLLADDPSLLAAEVFDASAISLFNTDRGAIGEQVPPSWLTASLVSRASSAKGSPDYRTRAWTVSNADSVTIGLPIRGPFGEIAGQVTITSTPPSEPTPWLPIAASLLSFLLLSMVCLILAVWLLRALGRQRDHAGMSQAEARLQDAETRLARALADLKRNEDLA